MLSPWTPPAVLPWPAEPVQRLPHHPRRFRSHSTAERRRLCGPTQRRRQRPDYSTFLGGSKINTPTPSRWTPPAVPPWPAGTWSSDFPTTPGAFDTSYHGGTGGDGFVAQFSSDGSALLYSTFLGGCDDDHPSAIAVDNTGRATVAGSTLSWSFPTTPGAFDTSFNSRYGPDGFVTKMFMGPPNGQRPVDHPTACQSTATWLTGASGHQTG